MTERQIEMLWRCTSCSHKNLGRYATCQSCKNPKDGTEQYEMPSDTAAAQTVDDPKLLRLATAGENWKCQYCGSDQRALDGKCQQCGAASDLSEPAPAPRPPPLQAPAPRRGPKLRWVLLGVFSGTAMLCFGAGLVAYLAHRPFRASVASLEWEHVEHVERYQVFHREGFAENRPAAAFNVKPAGKRHHHDDQVVDGYNTEYYTERVSDGYATEHYTARVSCGQDCTSRPKSCSERCTSNSNGFATCRTVCTGGGQSCTTRYCSESRTRQVPKYRNVQRSRQVPRYRAVPRDAPWFTFDVWDWAPNRDVTTRGRSGKTRWATPEELQPPTPLGEGEQERTRREGSYKVTFVDEKMKFYEYAPASLEEFEGFRTGATLQLRDEGGGKVTPVRPEK